VEYLVAPVLCSPENQRLAICLQQLSEIYPFCFEYLNANIIQTKDERPLIAKKMPKSEDSDIFVAKLTRTI